MNRQNSRLVQLFCVCYCLAGYVALTVFYIWASHFYLNHYQQNLIYLGLMFLTNFTFNRGRPD